MPNVSLNEFYVDKRVLVTGGYGFVGSHLATTLARYGADVTLLDIDTRPERPSLVNESGARERMTTIDADITDARLMNQLLEKKRYDYIFHLAAYATAIERAVENPYSTICSNTMGTINLLEAIRLLPSELRPKALLLTSTDKVYGEMDGEPYQEEKTPLRGIGMYDSAKLAADVFARTYHEVFGLPTVVLRMCNLFGPQDYSEYRLIPCAMKQLFGEKEPKAPDLYFDAIEHWRDYLYVSDAVRAILLLACEAACRGNVYNLSACTFRSTPQMLKRLVELAAIVESEFDADRALKIRQNGIRVTGHLEEAQTKKKVVTIQKQHLNGDKIHAAVGFEPQVTCDEGLIATIKDYRRYYLANREVVANGDIGDARLVTDPPRRYEPEPSRARRRPAKAPPVTVR